MQFNKGNKAEAVESVIYRLIVILIVNSLLENLVRNHTSFQSVVRNIIIIIIIIDKSLRIVGDFLLQGHSRWAK